MITKKGNATIVDTATPFLKHMAKENPEYIDKSLKSAGWWMRGEVKQGIREGAPGGRPYKPYHPITKAGRLDAMRGRGKIKSGKRYRAPRRYWLNKEHQPMGKLYKAVRYRFYGDSHRVLIGWLNRSARYYGEIQEEGKKVYITDDMRKFFWAAGVPLDDNTHYLEIPPRPTIEPEYDENEREIPRYLERKIWGYMERV